MYYNSNKVNNDYYNSYKKEISKLQDAHKVAHRKKVINSMFMLLILSLLLLASFYFYKYYNPKVESAPSHSKIIIKEENLPVSTQLIKSTMQLTKSLQDDSTESVQKDIAASINKKDVELIVKIIMAQMNTKVEDASIVEGNHHTQNLINKEKIVYRNNEMRIIIVQKGDTLSKIAKRAYGNHADYKKILLVNPEIIDHPNQIYVGQRLRIPS